MEPSHIDQTFPTRQNNQRLWVRFKSKLAALNAGWRALGASDVFSATVGDKGTGVILGGLQGLLLVFGLYSEAFLAPFKLHADLALVLL